MNKKTWIIIIVSLLIVAFVGVNIYTSQATSKIKVETTSLTEELMRETVITPGKLTLKDDQYIYYEREKGQVAEVFVEQGDNVKKGDKLLRYENESLEREQKQNELQLRSLYLEIDDIKKQHDKIDKELDKDKKNELLQQEHDQISLQHKLRNIDLERALLQKETIEKELENLVVFSEVDGTILSVDEKAMTESSMEQTGIIHIGSLEHVIVEATISEFDTLKIEEGQQVILTSEVLPDEEWEGRISYISDLPQQSSHVGMEGDSAVLYRVEVEVDDKIPLKPGFKILLDIITSEETVQTIPVNAVQQIDDTNYVYIVDNGKAKRTEVQVGKVDSENIEIIDGITTDEKVINNPSKTLTDGTEVTVQ